MASLAAQQVAHKVLETIRQGKKPVISKIAMQSGYAKTSAETNVPQNTASYKAIIDPALNGMIRLRNRALVELNSRDLSGERFDTLSQSIARLTHDIQLLSGKSTDNVAIDNDRQVLLTVIEQLRQLPKPE